VSSLQAHRGFTWYPYSISRGADIVEVAPAYDHGDFSAAYQQKDNDLIRVRSAEITGIAAADLVHDFLSLLLSKEPPQKWGDHGRAKGAH
jgi:agmatinase